MPYFHAGITQAVEQEIAEHVRAQHAHELRLTAKTRHRDRHVGRSTACMLHEHARLVGLEARRWREINQRFTEADDALHFSGPAPWSCPVPRHPGQPHPVQCVSR